MIDKKDGLFSVVKARMKDSNFLTVVVFFLAGLTTRLLCIAKMSTYPDDAQWALALKYFTLFIYAPGHPLYIILAKLVNYVIKDFLYSFVALSVLFSGLFASGIFYTGKEIFNKRIGIIASLIFLTSPFFWYYGVITIYFMPIGFFGLMTALFCYKVIVKHEKRHIFAASIFYALMIGIRPQESMTLLPLWSWAIWKSKQESLKGIIVFAAICLGWFIPMLIYVGGLFEYFKFFASNAKHNISGCFLYNLPTELIKKNFITLKIKILLLTYGIGVIPLFYYLYPFFNLKSVCRSIKTRFFLIWIMPALILYSFVLFGFDAMGYLITSCSALLIYLAVAIEGISQEAAEVFNSFSTKIKASVEQLSVFFLAVLVLSNAFIFLYDCDLKGKAKDNFEYQSYANIKKKDKMLEVKYNYIRQNFNPQNTIVLTRFWYFFSTIYHLPEYRVYAFDSIDKSHQGTTLRFGYKHQKNYYLGWGQTLRIPGGVTKIVLADDCFLEWNKSPELTQTIYLAGLYTLQIVKVKEGQVINCSFKNFSVIGR